MVAEERATPVHSTARTSSRSHRLGRGPVAGHHRQFARGDVAVESRNCHGPRRRRRCASPAQVPSVTSDSVGHHRRACATNASRNHRRSWDRGRHNQDEQCVRKIGCCDRRTRSALESVYVLLAMHACRSVVAQEVVSCARPSESEPALVSSSSATPWEVLESISVSDVFRRRSKTLQCCPVHLKGRFRQAAQLALEARLLAVSRDDVTKETRPWTLFCSLPYRLHCRLQSNGCVGTADLSRRFDQIRERTMGNVARGSRTGRSRISSVLHAMTLEQKAKAAEQCVREGEVSRARQCLTGAALAPGNDATFQETQPRRPQALGRPCRKKFLILSRTFPFNWIEAHFCRV